MIFAGDEKQEPLWKVFLGQNLKQRLLTISLNIILIIFACLYWKSQGISGGMESGHPVNYD